MRAILIPRSFVSYSLIALLGGGGVLFRKISLAYTALSMSFVTPFLNTKSLYFSFFSILFITKTM